MPELPPLAFGAPQVRPRATRQTPRPRLEGPGASVQAERLGPSLQRLTDAFTAGRVSATSQPEANPEQIIVLEVAGELLDFAAAVRRFPGLEFLAEEAEERLESDGEFRAVDKKGKVSRYDRQLYVVASDGSAWQQLLGLWQRFQNGDDMPRNFAKYKHLFSRLRAIRPWDDQDRLGHTGALEVWAHELSGLGQELVAFEVELWPRQAEPRRRAAVASLRDDLIAAGGDILSESLRPEISYHGVLARLPAERLLDAVAHREIRWMNTGAVRFFRPVGQTAAVASPDEAVGPVAPIAAELPTGDPVVALLDGVPLSGHDALSGRLLLDDVEGWGAVTEATRRLHGTAMASIVVHGDLSAPGIPQRRPVYVRPVLRNDAPDWVTDGREELPRDQLPVDVLHAAVLRLFVGEAVAPTVKVIVLAVGDSAAQFTRFVSPMARLLDWLSHRFGVLFVVSAGNHVTPIDVPMDVDLGDAAALQHEVLAHLHRTRGLRRLLAPAEAVNALTVGAAHADGSLPVEQGLVDPIADAQLPAVTSAIGAGLRRAVKPDVLLPGGRQALRAEPSEGGGRSLSIVASRRSPGVRAATPGTSGQLDRTTYECGTSVAAAFGGHHAGHILDDLAALRGTVDGMPDATFDAVVAKAALAHTARWRAAGDVVRAAEERAEGGRTKESIARLLGYGSASPADVLRCDDHRVTVLAARNLADGEAHAHAFPLPASLAAVTHHRRLTLTLAWLTPVNPDHRAYRRAALKLDPARLPASMVERLEADANGCRRGTLQHEVLDGRRAVPYAARSSIELVVSCRADAGDLLGAVPYALFVTLEVPQALGLPIYQQVRQGLGVPVPVRPRS